MQPLDVAPVRLRGAYLRRRRLLFVAIITYDNRQAFLLVPSVRIHPGPQQWMCDLAERL